MAKLLYLSVVSFLAAVFSITYFDTAFPVVSLSIDASQKEVIASALALRSAELHVRPLQEAKNASDNESSVQSVAVFKGDTDVQHFVELGGGGNNAFKAILQRASTGTYSPFTWQVRTFRPSDRSETLVKFTPAGEAIGFTTTLPEDEYVEELPVEAARSLAEKVASASPWSVDMTNFELVEETKNENPGKRIDHTFVYELIGTTIPEDGQGIYGIGRYRLSLVVAGNKVSSLNHFVKVPQAFQDTYKGLRSSNEVLANAAWICITIVYGLGGVIGGIFYLLRRKVTLFKPGLKNGALLALGLCSTILSAFPLSWMNYNTAEDPVVVYLDLLMRLLVNAVYLTLLAGLTLVAAEGLGRCADEYGNLNHHQFFRSTILIGTNIFEEEILLGYLLVPIMFAYEVLFYFLCTEFLGWWTPSSPVVNPNIAAEAFPGISALSLSLFAGCWEEALFRGVPLAGALLFFRRYRLSSRRTFWFYTLAILAQAAIFGAAHADYPAQPWCARLVELIIPSISFALLWYNYGLVPGMITHFMYDVIWFALPIFMTPTSSLIFSKVIVILIVGAPLFSHLFIKLGRKSKSKDQAYQNQDWFKMQEKTNTTSRITDAKAIPRGKIPRNYLTMFSLLVPILSALLINNCLEANLMNNFRWVIPNQRHVVLTKANELMGDRIQDSQLEITSNIQRGITSEIAFVLDTGNSGSASKLLNAGFLSGPEWTVRFARFNNGSAESNDPLEIQRRAEEWRVTFSAVQEPRLLHILPESISGVNITYEKAKNEAMLQINDMLSQSNIKKVCSEVLEILASPKQLPNRTDWNFKYKCTGKSTSQLGLPEGGDLHFSVQVSNVGNGPEFGITQYIKVPEAYVRSKRNRDKLASMAATISTVIILLGVLFGGAVGLNAWSKGSSESITFPVTHFYRIYCFLVVLGCLKFGNNIPEFKFQMTTSEPITNQFLSAVFTTVASLCASNCFISLAICGTSTLQWRRVQLPSDRTTIYRDFIIAACAALLIAVTCSENRKYFPALGLDGVLSNLEFGNQSIFVAFIISSTSNVVRYSCVALLFNTALDYVVHGKEGATSPVNFGIILKSRLFLGLILLGASIQLANPTIELGINAIDGQFCFAVILNSLALSFTYIFVAQYRMDLLPLIAGFYESVMGIEKVIALESKDHSIDGLPLRFAVLSCIVTSIATGLVISTLLKSLSP